MTSYLKLGDNDQEGFYQLILVSDDGSNFFTDAYNTGIYKKIINNDGVHSNQVGCTAIGGEISMKKETRLPIKIEYYQGPRTQIALSVLWRRVLTASSQPSSNCGFSTSNSSAWHDQSTGMYKKLKDEGFTVLTENNYISD